MNDRKLAPHVARAIGAAQAKPISAGLHPAGPRPALPTKGPSFPAPAAHVRQAVAAVQAKPAVQATAPRGPAPHVARAMAAPGGEIQAKAALAPAPASHVAAAIASQAAGVVQPSTKSKKDLDEKKKTVRRIVGNVNKQVAKLTPGRNDYFESQVTSIQDQKVVIKNLPRQNMNLTRTQSHISSLAYVVKYHFDAGPELQVGLLGDKNDDSTAFVFSSNTRAANSRIEKFTAKRTNLKSYYLKELRHRNVQLRLEQIRKEARKVKITKMRQILAKTYKLESKDEWRFLSLVSREIALEAHNHSRQEEFRLRMKAARRMSYKWKLRRLPIEVTQNTQNIHSESSILTEYPDNKKRKLKLVMGTKVPCVSCLAFFRGKKVPEKILDHTSATWLSISSMSQLGFDKDEIEDYLLHIAKVLKGANVYQHVSRDGEIKVQDLDIDNDPSSDSEDEDAIDNYDYTSLSDNKAGTKLQDTIHDFIEDNF